MAAKKLSAIWRIVTSKNTLEGKMRLVLFMQEFYTQLADDLEQTAIKAGQLHTLQALRAITEDKLEKTNER